MKSVLNDRQMFETKQNDWMTERFVEVVFMKWIQTNYQHPAHHVEENLHPSVSEKLQSLKLTPGIRMGQVTITGQSTGTTIQTNGQWREKSCTHKEKLRVDPRTQGPRTLETQSFSPQRQLELSSVYK